MEKIVYLIPGYMEDYKSRSGYAAVTKLLKSHELTPLFVKINWKRTTITDWVSQLNEVVRKNGEPYAYIGFSFGANTAFVSTATAKIQPKNLILCSLSSYFKEDLSKIMGKSAWTKGIGKRRFDDFDKIKFNELAPKIRSNTVLLIGTKERDTYPQLGVRADEVPKRVPGSRLISVKDSPHDIGNPEYLRTLDKLFGEL